MLLVLKSHKAEIYFQSETFSDGLLLTKGKEFVNSHSCWH